MEGQEVEWKRLVQFALLGSSDLEQYANLVVRVSLGLFFAISGANKLFVAGLNTIHSAKMQYWMCGEGPSNPPPCDAISAMAA
jgi:hypothetical protein